jgi:hypothetical protein
MSMNSEPENFEELRRLLALKRHEQPPPGYFHDFSRRVITRIKTGERSAPDSFLDRFIAQPSWLRRLWGSFEAKPILAGAFGVGVCGLLVVGLVSSERSDANPSAPSTDNASPQTIFDNVPNQTLFERQTANQPSTEPVFPASSKSSIFDEIRKPHVQPLSFEVPSSSY